ncbi:MAG TPA: hypothetical protein VFO76_08090, partial [Candidatus Kapabacteria bacterium]|nr:hypothetical protein [Candidatus Kapabacteria bacterium]
SRLAAQELFIQTEPASNMPAGRFGLRVSSDVWQESGATLARVGGELMYGLTKELMVHAQAYGSNQLSGFELETVGLYAKYRFFTDDAFKHHVRLAAYADILVGTHASMPEFSFKGSGPAISGGFIATLLENRLALSSTVGVSHALKDIPIPGMTYRNITGINASFSAGYLLYPSHYQSYNDPNINVYAELLGYRSWYDMEMVYSTKAKQGTELILSLGPQLILNSVLRIDLAYSTTIYNSYDWKRSNSFFARVEYNFY